MADKTPAAWITTVDLTAAMGDKINQYLNVDVGASIAGNAQVLEAISGVNSYIDQAIRRRYDPDVVVTEIPQAIVSRGIDMVLYTLKRKFRPDILQISDSDANRDAERYFKDIANGVFLLDFPATNRQNTESVPSQVRLGDDLPVTQDQQVSEQPWFNTYF